MNNIKMLPPLLAFAAVANQKSFTLAAKQLGMSKSAISQQVKRLEQHLGQQLLSRHTRGMSLTAVGQKLLTRSELLQDQVNLAFEELNTSKESPSGTFSLTIPHSCERNIVIPALNQLCVEYPDIEPKLLVTDEVRDMIKDDLDVAIYGGELQDSNYRALPLGSGSEIFCASAAYVQKYGQLEQLEDVNKVRWITAPWQKDPLPIYKNDDLNHRLSLKIESFSKTNTLPSVVEMVSHGMGAALLPEFVVQTAIADGQLVRVLSNYQGQLWPFYLLHRFHGEKPIHITRFYQLVKHFFAKANAGI